MTSKDDNHQHALEIMLIILAVGISALFYKTAGYRMVVLNLFYLPVVLGGFFLGRYRTGILALFCVLCASIITALNLTGFAAYTSPLVIGLVVCVWGATLGLTALLVGTLSDELTRRNKELHEAYVSVVEVLSQYLQGANPSGKARSVRIAELSQKVAAELKLPAGYIDDIRVAALLYDMGNVEITARVIKKAVGILEADPAKLEGYTFRGADLVLSLAPVLKGALPLLLDQPEVPDDRAALQVEQAAADPAIGTKIIRTVRAYDALVEAPSGGGKVTPEEALRELRHDRSAYHDPQVLDALERLVCRPEYAVAPAGKRF